MCFQNKCFLTKKNNDNENINIPIISESSGRVHITVDDPTSVSSANKNEFNDESLKMCRIYRKNEVQIQINAKNIYGQ